MFHCVLWLPSVLLSGTGGDYAFLILKKINRYEGESISVKSYLISRVFFFAKLRIREK